MKILLVTNLCSRYRVKLFELLHKMDDMKFLFFSTGEESYYDGERLLGDFRGEYLWGFYLLPKIKINPKLIRELLFYDYTHVIKCINGPFPVLVSFVISKLRRKKFILWTGIWHHPSTLFHKISFLFVKYLYRHSDAIIVYGPHVKRYLVSLGLPEERIAVAWQVQDNTKFERPVSDEQRAAKKREIGIITARVILFVGRLTKGKGILVLLEAFQSINTSDVSLLLIGRGPLEEELQRKISSLDRVFHISHVPNEELYLYYGISDILVLPSITSRSFKEPWGFVVNEAMCQGCAIVTSDAVGAGVGGLVEHGRNGYIVPENNTHALTDALEKILADDKLLDQMKAASLKIIREWTYTKMARGFVKAIQISNGEMSNIRTHGGVSAKL